MVSFFISIISNPTPVKCCPFISLCVFSCFSHVQLFATPWAIDHQAPLSMECSRQEYWSGFPFPPPGDLPHPRIKPSSPVSPALAGEFFTTSATFSPTVQFSSVAQLCPTLCDPMNCSMPCLPVHHQPKLMSIKSVMPSSHLILCHPLLLLPPTPPSIRVFSNESTLRMRWPKYWSFSFIISPSNEHRTDLL